MIRRSLSLQTSPKGELLLSTAAAASYFFPAPFSPSLCSTILPPVSPRGCAPT